MKVLVSTLTGISLTILLPSLALGMVFGGSNLSFSGYPDHSCSPPYSKPIKPYQFNEQWEVDQYNSEVDTYNFQVQTFMDCINEYVDNAQNDIKRVQEKANEAVDAANML